LSLAGFKSFADRTRLEFEPGFNVVVGPNGTGKSNLVDAIAWVMGTQATKALRTEKMDDVIFAGTTARPALGRAEVSLTFDNSDGFLPIDLAEVTVSRRLFRDGTSEYALNGTQVRLLDIQELLSDGGVGRRQHVLVGQGEIGLILNARPDEHRSVVEEAAGVTKHRGRRDRSIRRLEQTETDVHRLLDLLHEQRRRLRPLKRQANAAEQYDSVRAEARSLRLWIGGEELRRVRTRLEMAEQAHLAADTIARGDRDELDAVEQSLAGLRDAAGEAGRALERDTAAAARLETAAERLQRIGMVAKERRVALENRLRGAGERRGDLEAEQAHLEAEITAALAEESSAGHLAERREMALQQLEDEERSLAEQAQLPAEGVVANLRGDLRALETAAQRDEREAAAVEHRREIVAARLVEEAAEADRINRDIETIDAAAGAAQDAYDTAAGARAAAETRWEGFSAAESEARMLVSEAQARCDAFQAALADGADPAGLRRAIGSKAVIGRLVSLLDVPEDVARAVDAALGAWSEAVVAGDGIEDVVSMLKAEGLGGVAVAAAAWDESVPAAAGVAAEWGVDLLIDRLGPSADRAMAVRLLGDVVVVEGWSSGWALVRRHPGVRAVTPEGDLVTMAGLLLPQPDGAGPAALEAAHAAREDAANDLARAASRAMAARREFDRARDDERQALEALEALEARLAGSTEALAVIERTRAEGDAESTRLEDRRRALVEAAAARDERLTEMRLRLEEFAGEEAVRQAAWEALVRRREEVAARRDEARRQREAATAALATAVERRRMLEHRRAEVAQERFTLEDEPADPAEIERLYGIETRARAALEIVRDHVTALRERQRRLRERASEADRRFTAAGERRSELQRSVDDARTRAGELAVEIAELRVRNEAAGEGLRRDADATEEEALATSRPETPDDVDLAERYESLRARLRRMGPINPLAAEEYRELAEQVDFLETQLADLEESRRELRKVIAALDEEIGVLFRQAFDEINEFYQENFGLVFPGGRGRLRLTDPDDPLSSGVDIDAQPHGKKIGRLSLLSGGERSLAALAFLFAVFRARPSPFYVLDEVEAALDDANLRRFLRLVDTLRQSAQLVIITHQQQTMEAGDMLYGVTMEPGGSSKVLTKRLAEILV
jgi:chromosome segregation protein